MSRGASDTKRKPERTRDGNRGDGSSTCAGSNGRRRPRATESNIPLVSDSFLRPSFTLEQVRTFLTVASREHVTHAAQVLRLSQPAVTQQIQLLERALDVRLLERVGRNVRLTDAGVEVAGACLLIMRALENLENVAQAIRGLKLGSVAIGASQLAANYFLVPVITDFVAVHPQINLGVVVDDAGEVCQHVASGRLECGLIDGPPPAPESNLMCMTVATTEVVIVTHPRHAMSLDAASAGDQLNQSRYLAWSPGSATDMIAAQIIDSHYECYSRIQIGSMEAARRLVLDVPGFVTAMPLVAVSEEIRSGMLTRLCHDSVALPVFAIRRQGPDSPVVEALWQALAQRRLPGWDA